MLKLELLSYKAVYCYLDILIGSSTKQKSLQKLTLNFALFTDKYDIIISS